MISVTLEVLRTGDIILRNGNCSQYFGTDWDRPFVASLFGWTTKHQNYLSEDCEGWRSTDGTIVCQKCGLGASYFIQSATEWLDNRGGETVEVEDSYVNLEYDGPEPTIMVDGGWSVV